MAKVFVALGAGPKQSHLVPGPKKIKVLKDITDSGDTRVLTPRIAKKLGPHDKVFPAGTILKETGQHWAYGDKEYADTKDPTKKISFFARNFKELLAAGAIEFVK